MRVRMPKGEGGRETSGKGGGQCKSKEGRRPRLAVRAGGAGPTSLPSEVNQPTDSGPKTVDEGSVMARRQFMTRPMKLVANSLMGPVPRGTSKRGMGTTWHETRTPWEEE